MVERSVKNRMYELFGIDTGFVAGDTFSNPIASNILKRRDTKALKLLFSRCQNNSNHRYFYSLTMSRHFPLRRIKKWVDQEPSSADANLIYGARLLKLAWDARGYGRGSKVTEECWIKFYEILDLTESILLKAAKLNESDPTPWVYLIMVAVYRSGDKELNEEYFNEAVKRDSSNWHAHMNRLTGLSKKYGGSDSEMFEFARVVRKNSPSDCLLQCLILKAHSECWKYKYAFERDDEAAESYRNNPEVIAECLDAYNMSLTDRNRDLLESIFVRINAAGTFYILRQKAPLKRELHMLGDSIQDIHWRWVGAEGQLEEARRFAVE